MTLHIETAPDGTENRRVLRAMIYNSKVLKAIAPHWPRHGGLFHHTYGDLIGRWCVQYYTEYKKAPGLDDSITLFEAWKRAQHDDGAVKLVYELLESVWRQREGDKPSSAALIKTAETVFNRIALCDFGEAIRNGANNGQLPKLLERAASFQPITLTTEEDVPASALTPKAVSWVWPGWLARGELSLMDGLPGDGKGTLIVELAARLSRGWPMPSGERMKCKPINVAIISNEDSWEHTILPRLIAANADLDRVYPVRNQDESPITFPKDTERLRRLLEKHKIGFVGIDSVMSCISDGAMDGNQDAPVRAYLTPLVGMLRERGCALLGSRHFKKEKANAIHRGVGSQAWTAVTRIQLTVGRIEDGGQLYIAQAKNNLAPLPPSLAYGLDPVEVPIEGTDVARVARIAWQGEAPVTANQITCPEGKRGRPEISGDISACIVRHLTAAGGTISSVDLQTKVCEEMGCGFTAYKKGKDASGARSRKRGMGEWEVYLPEESGQE